MNLRELTRKVARDVGISLPAVQLFSKQMLAALYHMHDCGVLHADIKPDNILINSRHNAVKASAARCRCRRPHLPHPRLRSGSLSLSSHLLLS